MTERSLSAHWANAFLFHRITVTAGYRWLPESSEIIFILLLLQGHPVSMQEPIKDCMNLSTAVIIGHSSRCRSFPVQCTLLRHEETEKYLPELISVSTSRPTED